VLRVLSKSGLVSPDRLEKARKRYGSRDYAQASGVIREVLVKRLGESYEEDLASLELPVVLLWGALDHTVPLSVAERSLQVLSHGELEVIEATGHLLPTERPESLRRVIEANL
jgi:pimeloyl-ACP methyl ester carboxylesterase